MSENNIQLRSIASLSEYKFMIPEYQRGYRWEKTQAIQLLEDIRKFYQRKKKEAGEFYCLQPIVVKCIDESTKTYEVIDGQQRLTTIFIILKSLESARKLLYKSFSLYTIEYNSRKDSKEFLETLGQNSFDSDSYIDFYYMNEVFSSVTNWINTEEKAGKFDTADFLSTLLKSQINNNEDEANNVRIIWYEVKEKNATSVDIFTRLNIGKIPLSNSELIKALLLKKDNFGISVEMANLKQIQIATEWNQIEQKLQNDSFWYFVYSSRNQFSYENRIELIFDLMKEKKKEHELYYTFNKFNEQYECNGGDVELIWQDVKFYFQTLEEWFEDRDLYHYIGFLIEYGEDITALKEDCDKFDKEDFKKKIFERIKKRMKDCRNLDEITYHNVEKVRKVLLLFNICTVLETQKSDMRFPFNKFKQGNWDIEHVCSQTDKILTSVSEQKAWIKDMLEYFSDYTYAWEEEGNITANVAETVSQLFQDGQDISTLNTAIKKLKDFQSQEKINSEEFNDVFEYFQKKFNEGMMEDKDDMSNLALLDSETNRSYGNAFFPIKRKYIINNDKRGVFVPITTKNLFLKYYSKNVNNMLVWTNTDAADYIDAIKEKLSQFINEE
ncbi:MAG: DUF262 domain-containing protein [Bacteroidales bacterium]|nr:DUF262 domain-containing protein [Bacteroidales bacterium]